jgi:quercetin dioxygenase-like cupin family protein
VWIDSIAQGHGPSPMSIGSVHFAPGARTAWHRHGIGQTLYVTEGEGRVQSRGERVMAIHTGDVVHTPGDEWHWHGAAPDHYMTHLSMAEGGADWGEHVTDAEYRSEPEAR